MNKPSLALAGALITSACSPQLNPGSAFDVSQLNPVTQEKIPSEALLKAQISNNIRRSLGYCIFQPHEGDIDFSEVHPSNDRSDYLTRTFKLSNGDVIEAHQPLSYDHKTHWLNVHTTQLPYDSSPEQRDAYFEGTMANALEQCRNRTLQMSQREGN